MYIGMLYNILSASQMGTRVKGMQVAIVEKKAATIVYYTSYWHHLSDGCL